MIGQLEVGASGRRPMIFDVRYATRTDGAKTAYGVIGSGPVLLFPPSIMSILEWVSESPTGPDYFAALAAHRTVVTYDRHGCGLSDRDRTDFTLADDMLDIEAVVRLLGDQPLDVVATSHVAIALAFAALHPERVRRLVLCEATLSRMTPRYEAMLHLIETNREAWIQALTGLAFPSGADKANIQSVANFLRTAASLEVLLGLLRNHPGQDEPYLERVKAPTLVVHRRRDAVSALDAHAAEVAARIPDARLLPIDGDEHIPWTGDWLAMAEPIIEFLLQAESPPASGDLTPRETEILRLLARGKSNPEIAVELVISVYTVQRHVSSILHKTELRNRTEAVAYAIRNHLV